MANRFELGYKAWPILATPPTTDRVGAPPESYTPKHLAEKILTSKAALEGERKQVTVLFADLKGSMEPLPTGTRRRRGSCSILASST